VTSPGNAGRAAVVGTGLIGGSIGLALRARGWYVTGHDRDRGRAEQALGAGALDAVGVDPDAQVTFVATPLDAVTKEVAAVFGQTGLRRDTVVTDVAGVKGPVVAAVDDPRFVGGHPMAGSEQVGLAGADPELFVGATWVLTPTAGTDAAAYSRLQAVVVSLGAEVVALSPQQHDALVAVVSHVPHLTAATLMDLASGLGQEHAALLQLAAGGFRDMTRIAAGQPAIWLDICEENADAIVETLDLLIDALGAMRRRVADHDHQSLLEILDRASTARRALGERAPLPEELVEVRVPVPDRTGMIAEITVLVTELGINIVDLEIAHSVDGNQGVMLVVVDQLSAPTLLATLSGRGYRATSTPVGPIR
jgi:prephenate dehydrogenase